MPPLYKHYYKVTVILSQIKQGSCNTNIDVESPFRRLDISQADAYSFLSKIEDKLSGDEDIVSVKYSKKNPDLWVTDDGMSGDCSLVILSKSPEYPYESISGDNIICQPRGAVVILNLYANYKKTAVAYKSPGRCTVVAHASDNENYIRYFDSDVSEWRRAYLHLRDFIFEDTSEFKNVSHTCNGEEVRFEVPLTKKERFLNVLDMLKINYEILK